jgi:hypothetical protein
MPTYVSEGNEKHVVIFGNDIYIKSEWARIHNCILFDSCWISAQYALLFSFLELYYLPIANVRQQILQTQYLKKNHKLCYRFIGQKNKMISWG